MAEDNVIDLTEERQKQISEIAREISFDKGMLDNEEAMKELAAATANIKSELGLDIPEELLGSIGAMFALPDEQFKLISDEFLLSFEKSLNNPEDKIAICQALNISNVKMEDLYAAQQAWNESIEDSLRETFSQIKIDFIKKAFNVVINAIQDSEGISKRVINIPTILTDGAAMPVYAHDTDSGADVCALEEVELLPGETKIIPTGIKVEVPIGYEIQVRPRSGLSAKSKLRIANAPGTIDAGYRGEIGIICTNTEPKIKDVEFDYTEDGIMDIKSVEFGSTIIIEKGQKIAQLVLAEVPKMRFVPVAEFEVETDRGEGGFGSTDNG